MQRTARLTARQFLVGLSGGFTGRLGHHGLHGISGWIEPLDALERSGGQLRRGCFAPAQGIFAAGQTTQFDTVRTFVAQVTHLAQANYFFFGWSGIKPDRDLKAIGSITTKDEAVAALEASFVYAHKAIATITTENAFVAIKPVDGFSTRATIAAFAAAHGNDHYGQMVEYLRMNGIVPPASAK